MVRTWSIGEGRKVVEDGRDWCLYDGPGRVLYRGEAAGLLQYIDRHGLCLPVYENEAPTQGGTE